MRPLGIAVALANFLFAGINMTYGLNHTEEMHLANWMILPINVIVGFLLLSRIPPK